jgi:hypothetical protein
VLRLYKKLAPVFVAELAHLVKDKNALRGV